MVIEIDRKKIAKQRRNALLTLSLYVVSLVMPIYGFISNPADRNWWVLAVLLVSYTAITFIMAGIIRRVARFSRTDHHIFLDENSLAMIDGHARIDIPWGDIEQISLKSKEILVKLRPDTPYNKRKYHLFNNYELPLSDVYAQMKELWTAGQEKSKFQER